MGMFTTVRTPDDLLVQFKTGFDGCETYEMWEEIPWEPDPWSPGSHLDGVHWGVYENHPTGRDVSAWVVVRDRRVVAVVEDSGDVSESSLLRDYGIGKPDPALWTEAQWEGYRLAKVRAMENWKREKTKAAERIGKPWGELSSSERLAASCGILMGQMRRDYSSIGRLLFQIEALPEPVEGVYYSSNAVREGGEGCAGSEG